MAIPGRLDTESSGGILLPDNIELPLETMEDVDGLDNLIVTDPAKELQTLIQL